MIITFLGYFGVTSFRLELTLWSKWHLAILRVIFGYMYYKPEAYCSASHTHTHITLMDTLTNIPLSNTIFQLVMIKSECYVKFGKKFE